MSPEMVDIGISALKIEGRYKDADYVALTTAAYRKAVDRAAAGLSPSVSRDEELRLEQVYSRGLGPLVHSGHKSSASRQGQGAQTQGRDCGPRASVFRIRFSSNRARSHSSPVMVLYSMPPTGAVRKNQKKVDVFTK